MCVELSPVVRENPTGKARNPPSQILQTRFPPRVNVSFPVEKTGCESSRVTSVREGISLYVENSERFSLGQILKHIGEFPQTDCCKREIYQREKDYDGAR